MKVAFLFISLLFASLQPSFASTDTVPVGIRPCCAFGTGLKAELGSVPVPFFSIDNVLSPEDVQTHVFNDGSSNVVSSLFGTSEETNGLIFTNKGGFIDTAHVRDTADFAFYLYRAIKNRKEDSLSIHLTAELRERRIEMTNLDALNSEKLEEAKLAALLAFRLAQWHEVAQWYGLVSVGGFKEYASAFSPEDLYSNMLGALIALEMFKINPDISQKNFVLLFPQYFRKHLKQLDAQDEDITVAQLKELDGIWWDSNNRLPNKWVVKTRDYHFSLALLPNGVENGTQLALSEFSELEKYAEFQLVKADNIESFDILPVALKSKEIWTASDFQSLADVTKAEDDKHENNRNDALSMKLNNSHD
ncbi:DUF4056 domain-containing protein [Vibrio methylphosphonaticus]|uniref:DUF4056 domain-containing protein n=1 Tax=Vibrio methylphosphonaticus TaxID=2946866 RepID=UPI00202A0199|nr:DUF4056 domain-containing protein [Vibrio methylphosphonaticus]MCL9774260.1 DUF4056 domain-containing protein [Vibrio methylphosphonaticus]